VAAAGSEDSGDRTVADGLPHVVLSAEAICGTNHPK